MFKKLLMWAPVLVLLSIALDIYVHWNDYDYRMLGITAALGWIFYWESLFDIQKLEKQKENS